MRFVILDLDSEQNADQYQSNIHEAPDGRKSITLDGGFEVFEGLPEDMISRGAAKFEQMLESDAEGADWNTEEYVMHILEAALGLGHDQ